MNATFSTYDILYQDEGSSELHTIESASLVTEREASRLATAWQKMTWVEGRKFTYRIAPETNSVAKSEK